MEITAAGWRILNESPVRFIRGAGSRALPQPVPGGSLKKRRPLLNVENDNAFRLAIAWLLAGLRPDWAYPVLAIGGEAETAKLATRVREVLGDLSIEGLEADWQRHWLIQRGMKIISEASRHLPQAMKARHPEIPWTKVAGIGNVLRHGYQDIAAPVLWKLVREDLPHLERACHVDRAPIERDGAG